MDNDTSNFSRGYRGICKVTIMRIAIDKLSIVFSREPWWGEFWSGATAIAWSLIYVVSEGEDINYSVYFELSLLATSGFWKFAGIMVGIFQISCLVLPVGKVRWASSFMASWWWALLSVAIMNGEQHAPSLALYGGFACINLGSMIVMARKYA